jgi:hypothetical protein
VRILTKPSWLSTFTDTGENLVTSDTTLHLFAKAFPAGPIQLGGNESPGGNSMYSVIVKPQGGPPPSPTDPTTSTVVATPNPVLANGVASATVTVTLKDSTGTPVVGHPVTLAQGTGSSTIGPASGPSNASGQVTFSVTNTTVELVTYTATDTTDTVMVTQTADVDFTPPPMLVTDAAMSTVVAVPTSVPADGGTSATVTVTLKDSTGTPVVGHPVTLAQGTGSSTITPPNGISNASGQVTFSVTNTTVELVTYTATDTTIPNVTVTQTALVNFTAPPAGVTISNLTPASYVPVASPPGLQVGSTVYIDRAYPFTSVPALVQGQAYIQTANNSKTSTANPFLTFTVTQPVTVYVAHDVRILTKPSWLSTFTDTGENLVTSDTTLHLFAKAFPAGPIQLGGNESPGGNSMYSVIVKPQGGP